MSRFWFRFCCLNKFIRKAGQGWRWSHNFNLLTHNSQHGKGVNWKRKSVKSTCQDKPAEAEIPTNTETDVPLHIFSCPSRGTRWPTGTAKCETQRTSELRDGNHLKEMGKSGQSETRWKEIEKGKKGTCWMTKVSMSTAKDLVCENWSENPRLQEFSLFSTSKTNIHWNHCRTLRSLSMATAW